jgi:predicted small secreted protein
MKIVKTLLLSLVTVSVLGLANLACNTTEGAGKDIENAGKDIKHAAQDNK